MTASKQNLLQPAEEPTAEKTKRSRLSRFTVDPLRVAALKAKQRRSKHLKAQSKQSIAVGEFRNINLAGGAEQPGFVDNHIITAKYNIITFLPKFLFEVFSRVAYMYFAVVAGLSWWTAISPFGGAGSTIALAFVVTVSAITALIEDFKRHSEDKSTNRSTAHVVQPDGSMKDVQWSAVRVGQVLQVNDNELIPADMLCLFSGLPEKVCYVKTTNLDGETNLKIRNALELRDYDINSHADVLALRGSLSIEPPSANLHNIQGRIKYTTKSGEQTESVLDIDDVLLRGCTLKNSKFAVGVVLYTGRESRIQMNSTATPIKIGSYDRFLNIMIAMVIVLQIILCAWHATAATIFRSTSANSRYYLAMNVHDVGNPSTNFGFWIISALTFFLLYSYLVPISLFVTMEIVKFWQGFIFINFDPEMKDPVSKSMARCRNRGLNEDLGKVEYVFSDKTGTLTGNEMQLRMITVKDVTMGKAEWRIENHPDMPTAECMAAFDSTMADSWAALRADEELLQRCIASGGSSADVLGAGTQAGEDGHTANASMAAVGQHVLDFWLNLCICQSLIVDPESQPGNPSYQGPSPDEVALVDAARRVGFEFVGRSQSSITLSIQGQKIVYDILNMQEFSSARGCMSVVARSPNGTIRLYCKGADAKVLPRLRKDVQATLLANMDRNLHMFATKGLRTLLLGTRIMSEEEYNAWDERYQVALSDLDNRDKLVNDLADEIEQNLELVGVTAIEDKLQDGVPEAIATLLDGGIRVWMITGDKQETAINIGISCRLVRNPESLLICNGESYDAASQRLAEIEQHFVKLEAESVARHGQAVYGELVIDGKTLSYVLGTDLEPRLASIGARCHSVVICRASPSQKASIVLMMMQYEQDQASGRTRGLVRWWKRYNKRMKGKMLSIGDGANDVAMIQAANIGVGIMGKEGRQAVNNSDYAIAQFRFLVRLLLVHGTLSHYRLAKLIKYSFYKNITFNFVLFWFQFFCGYSGTTIIDGIPATAYNVVFTSLPILLFSLLDRPVKYFTTLLRYPQLYRKQQSLTVGNFLHSGVWLALLDATIIFFVPYFSIASNGNLSVTDMYSLGNVAFFSLLGVVTLEVSLVTRYWTWLYALFVVLSYLVGFLFYAIYPFFLDGTGQYDGAWSGLPWMVWISGYFWFNLLTTYAMCFGFRYLQRVIQWLHFPQDSMILTEKEYIEGPMGGAMTGRTAMRLKTLVRRDEVLDLDGQELAQTLSMTRATADVGVAEAPSTEAASNGTVVAVDMRPVSRGSHDEKVKLASKFASGYSDGQ